MRFFKVNIEKWIEKELYKTELTLLEAEDELQAAKLRVGALTERAARLRNHSQERAAKPMEID